MKATEKWAYSLDNEYYNSPFCDSFDDALKDGILEAKELYVKVENLGLTRTYERKIQR